ncbi:MAG: glycosyltransferase family 39 protein [Candidatus Levybacteria bacterium]|nr:glycosyltransferase family 39 protein [Candidatus Levybacteria bacterium]
MQKIKFILIVFLIWRLFLFLPLFLGYLLLASRSGYEYTNIWKFISPYYPVSSFFLYPWANFDGVHYLRIAGDGYTNNGGFFPFFPLIIHVASLAFGGSSVFGSVEFFSALILSNIFFLLAFIVFYFLIRFDFSEKIAVSSIVFLLLFPTSFFFGSIYTESLFLLLSLLCFFHARRKEWLQAGILGSLLTATRIVGISIFPVILYEFIVAEKVQLAFRQKKDRLKLFIKSLPLYFIPLGLLSYMWFNVLKWGNAFYFLKAQGTLMNGRSTDSIILFPQTLVRYAKILPTVSFYQYEWWIALLEISTFIIVSILLFVAWKKGIRFSYILFSLFCFLIPVSSGTFTGLPRYSVVLFPIFIALALINNKKIQIAYAIISTVLLFILLMLFSRGYFVA